MARTELLEPNDILLDVVYRNWGLSSPLDKDKIDFVTDDVRITKTMGLAFVANGSDALPIAGSSLITFYMKRYLIDVVIHVTTERGRSDSVQVAKSKRWTLLKEVERIVDEYNKSLPKHHKDWLIEYQLGRTFPPTDNFNEGLFAIRKRIEAVSSR